jgi:hypothetical protein
MSTAGSSTRLSYRGMKKYMERLYLFLKNKEEYYLKSLFYGIIKIRGEEIYAR